MQHNLLSTILVNLCGICIIAAGLVSLPDNPVWYIANYICSATGVECKQMLFKLSVNSVTSVGLSASCNSTLQLKPAEIISQALIFNLLLQKRKKLTSYGC